MEKTKYEVEVSVRLKGSFTVVADDESCAEDAVNLMIAHGEINLSDLESGEWRVDCVGEADDDAEPMNGGESEDEDSDGDPP